VTAALLAAVAALVAPTASDLHRPPIHRWPIPFGARRRAETAAYSARHYGQRTWRLRRPRVIVEHVAVAGSAGAVHATFVPDRPDPELHELPGLCAHFVVDARGRIYQFVPTSIRCRHTVGLNWTAIGIEHVGFDDGDVLGRARELRASLRLTRWLRCRYGIPVRDVIGHAESLRSPYHRERVRALRTQTHGDMRHASMVRYRRALARLGGCGPR
jgi:N-acetylmuramoyl-L-alanine amidase